MPESQSLGDAPKQDLVLTRYTEPLPGSRREIVSKFESILNRGGIQKITVQVKKPIEVVQLVDRSTAVPPMETPSDDLWDVIRNTKMEELRVADSFIILDAYELLFHAFAYLDRNKLKAKMLFVHDYKLLRAWLRLPEIADVGTIYGVEAAPQPNAPEDGVILVGVPYDEDSVEGTVGLRIPLDIPKQETTVVPLRKP